MLDDETRVAFKKMHEFSAADGFVEITEIVGDTIKFTANEPSVGLFFVQHHTKKAAPNLIKLKNTISRKSHETTLHTEDLNDSTTIVKAMKECGNPIIEEMIKDINKSLSVLSKKQPKIGLISSASFNSRTRRTSSWGHNNDGNYMSLMVSSAREKATSFKWAPFDSREWGKSKSEKTVSYNNLLQVEDDELPVSSPSDSNKKWVPLLEKRYDEFRAGREAKLEDWLGGEADEDGRI